MIVVKIKDDCILDDTITIVSVKLDEFEAVDLIEAEADEYGSLVECFVSFLLVESEGSNVIEVEGETDGINVFIGEFVEKLVE